MKTIRSILPAALALGLALPAVAAEPVNPSWGKLKSLAGEWVGTYEGQPARVSYKLVSGGTALMETLEVDKDGSQMVSLYHPDGTSLLMTHYCTLGNQPRMRAVGLKDGGLDFVYVDATNVRSKDEHVMSRLVMSFPAESQLVQEWTSKEGVKEETGRFEFTRKK